MKNLLSKMNKDNPAKDNPLAVISELCKLPDLNTEALSQMIDLHIKAQEHQAKLDYAAAMTHFASIKVPIPHNRTGKTAGNAPFSYADYPQMVMYVDPWMAECGLSHSHVQAEPVIDGGNVVLVMVTCVIKHIGGHSEPFSFPAVPDEKLRSHLSPSQLLQLAITYAKRQTLAMGLGLATKEDHYDDDSSAPPDLVSDEQIANLEALISEVGADKIQFLKFLKLEALSDLPASKYDRAVKRLQEKGKSLHK